MQILILYHSNTGTTQKIAEEIAKGVQKTPDITCILKSTEEVSAEDLINSDGIIAGSPSYLGTMSSELKSIFDNNIHLRSKMKNKIGAAFSCAACQGGGTETTIFSIIQAMLTYGMIISGNPQLTAGNFGATCIGTPEQQDLKNALIFGENVSLIVKKYYSS